MMLTVFSSVDCLIKNIQSLNIYDPTDLILTVKRIVLFFTLILPRTTGKRLYDFRIFASTIKF